jgi:hypothetical protein
MRSTEMIVIAAIIAIGSRGANLLCRLGQIHQSQRSQRLQQASQLRRVHQGKLELALQIPKETRGSAAAAVAVAVVAAVAAALQLSVGTRPVLPADVIERDLLVAAVFPGGVALPGIAAVLGAAVLAGVAPLDADPSRRRDTCP